MHRLAGLLVGSALVASAGCAEPSTQARARTPPRVATAARPAPPPREAAAVGARTDCEELLRTVDELATASARAPAVSDDELRASAVRLGLLGEAVGRGRDAPAARALGVDVERAVSAASFLSRVNRSALGSRGGAAPELVGEHARSLAERQLELARRAVRARCEPEPSRDQSAAWKQATFAALQLAVAEPVHTCVPEGAREALPDLEVKLHIGSDGRVTFAGPLTLASLDPRVVEFTHCVVRLCEQAVFQPPEGVAIVVVPFVRAQK